jgi:hypothetical protein
MVLLPIFRGCEIRLDRIICFASSVCRGSHEHNPQIKNKGFIRKEKHIPGSRAALAKAASDPPRSRLFRWMRFVLLWHSVLTGALVLHSCDSRSPASNLGKIEMDEGSELQEARKQAARNSVLACIRGMPGKGKSLKVRVFPVDRQTQTDRF